MPQPMVTINISLDQAEECIRLLRNENTARKNWIASAVEVGDFDRAKKLVEELRVNERLFADVNGPFLRAKGVMV